jgi:hypothetical protein
MRFKSIAHARPNVGPQSPKILDRLWGQNDLEAHSGQIIAKIYGVSKLCALIAGHQRRARIAASDKPCMRDMLTARPLHAIVGHRCGEAIQPIEGFDATTDCVKTKGVFDVLMG